MRHLTVRILMLNFAAIHTSSMLLSQTLFNLAMNPDKWLAPLRTCGNATAWVDEGGHIVIAED